MANTLNVVGNSIQLNRNLSTLDDGTLGPFTIEAKQNGVSGTANFNLIVSHVTAGTITTRTLTETSGSSSVPVGSPFRFGAAFKRGDVPAGASFNVVDGGGNVLSVQADAFNHWPDGSVRWCEVTGYTARAIAAGGADTLSITRATTAFNNTLPGGKTPAQLLTDLQSFTGAQDLNIALSSVASATGASNLYTNGTWTAHFNTLVAGPYVQQVNKGPCSMGFRAWGQLKNGAGQNHAHIHVAFYVWLWLNPSTGVIRDVEYIVYLHNSLLTQSTDGTPYTSFPPDRYNYNPALKNGATVIVNNSDATMLLPSGSPGVTGGHYPRSGWFTARADGTPRWIANPAQNTNLHVSLDPVQSNPQLVTTARDYLSGTGLLPRYDPSQTDCPNGLASLGTYSPLVKGVINNSFDTYFTGEGLNAGGNDNRIGYLTGGMIFGFMVQTPQVAQNNRITTLGFQSFPSRFLDVNGRIPNLTGGSLTGLTAATQIDSSYASPGTEWPPYAVNASLAGNWTTNSDTTHYPNLSYYTYLTEGGAHNRDCVAMQSGDTVFWYADVAFDHTNGNGINRAPVVSGTKYYGNRCCSWSADREEAWALREVMLPAAILPDALADGTVFGETVAFHTYLVNSFAFAVQAMNAMSAAQKAVGHQFFQGAVNAVGDAPSLGIPLPPTASSSEPWMQAYVGQVFANAYRLHGTDPALSANIASMCNFHRRYHESLLNTRCPIFGSIQSATHQFGHAGGYRPWPLIGVLVVGKAAGGDFNFANFSDTSRTGWITFSSDEHPGLAAWFSVPVSPGMTLFFTRDGYNQGGNGTAPPSPFSAETTYRVVTVDEANWRLNVCLDSDGTNTIVVPSTVVTGVACAIIQLAAGDCPTGTATYKDNSGPGGSGPPGTPTPRSYTNDEGQDAQLNGVLMAVRTYRQALGDTAPGAITAQGSAAADAAAANRILSFVGGSWSRTLYANRPANWIKYP